MAPAGVHELTRVVAVGAADDDDDVALARQIDRGSLTLLRRLAHRVEETDLRLRKPASDQRDQVPHPVDRLRRLRGNADAWMGVEPLDVLFVEHDVELVEVFGQSAHFHVIALADDHRVIAIAEERRDRPMCDVHQRTGRLDDLEAEGPGAGERPSRGAMRRHHDGLGLHVRDVGRDRRCRWRASEVSTAGL